MNKITIVTNRIPRQLMAKFQLPAKALKDFDYVKEEDSYTERFVKYRGCWYDVHDTMNVGHLEAFKGWDSYISDTYFSGVLFKLTADHDYVICGRYYS